MSVTWCGREPNFPYDGSKAQWDDDELGLKMQPYGHLDRQYGSLFESSKDRDARLAKKGIKVVKPKKVKPVDVRPEQVLWGVDDDEE